MNITADVVFVALAAALFVVGVFCWARGAVNAHRKNKK